MVKRNFGLKTTRSKHMCYISVVFQMRELPDYLCGKISFEIMKDPVITPSGITYPFFDNSSFITYHLAPYWLPLNLIQLPLQRSLVHISIFLGRLFTALEIDTISMAKNKEYNGKRIVWAPPGSSHLK